MIITHEEVLDPMSRYEQEFRVFVNGVYVGFIAWRFEPEPNAWYFQANESLGLDAEGGFHFWKVAKKRDNVGTAIWRTKRRLRRLLYGQR